MRTDNGSCQAQFWFQCCRTVNNFLLTTHFLCRPSLSKSKKGHSDRAFVLSKMHNLKQFLKTWIGFLKRVSQFHSVFFHQSVILTPIFMTTIRFGTHFVLLWTLVIGEKCAKAFSVERDRGQVQSEKGGAAEQSVAPMPEDCQGKYGTAFLRTGIEETLD